MKLEWRPQAFDDRERIMDFIARDNPQAALDLGALFEEKTGALTGQPKLYRSGRMKGTKEAVVHPNLFWCTRYPATRPPSCACCTHRWHGPPTKPDRSLTELLLPFAGMERRQGRSAKICLLPHRQSEG